MERSDCDFLIFITKIPFGNAIALPRRVNSRIITQGLGDLWLVVLKLHS